MRDYKTIPHYWINHLSFQIRKGLVQEFTAQGHKVTAEEWAALLLLHGGAGLTATELSFQSIRDKTTITRLIDKMVAKDLVERRPDTNDRRVIQLHLTANGQQVFEHLAKIAQAYIAASLNGVSPQALAVTLATLSKMNDNLNTAKEGAE